MVAELNRTELWHPYVCYCSSSKIEALTTSQLPTFKIYKKGELFDELPNSNPVGLYVTVSIF